MKIRITVKTLTGVILTFRVDRYEIINGNLIKIHDRDDPNKTKYYHVSNCEIEEVRE